MAERPVKVVPIQIGTGGGIIAHSLPTPRGPIGADSGAEMAGLSTVVTASGRPAVRGGTPASSSAQRVSAGPSPVAAGCSVLPATLRPITVLRTPGPGGNLTADQARALESFGPHIATLLLEVYRCRLCQFHSTSKCLVADHMLEKHSLAAASSQKDGPTSHPDNSGPTTAKVSVASRPAARLTLASTSLPPQQQQSAIRDPRPQSDSNPDGSSASDEGAELAPDGTVRQDGGMPVSDSDSDGDDGDGFGDDGDDDDDDNDVPANSSPSTQSTVTNALELLMAIGSGKDLAPLKSEEGEEGMAVAGGVVQGVAPVPAAGVAPVVAPGVAPVVAEGVAPAVISAAATVLTGGVAPILTTGVAPAVTRGVAPAAGAVPVVDMETADSQSGQLDLKLIPTTGSIPVKTEDLLTVNEAELSKTLAVDKRREGGANREEGSGHFKTEALGAALLKSIPIQIGLGGATSASASSIDLQEIANTASQSNPKATTITVLHHHGPAGQPPTAVQFKRSRKSAAIIPTGESLGITSPFGHRSSSASSPIDGDSYRGTKRFACPTCPARYKSSPELERHVQKKHQRRRPFLCEICGEALATRASVKYHVSRKHAAVRKIYRCNLCDYRTPFEARMDIHRATHQSEFVCGLCDKTYVSAERLQRHYASPLHKNALNPLVCEHCGYSSKKRDNFLVHMRKHTGEKPYKCKLCDYASADGSTLKKHVMAKHSTIRPFKCPTCSFSCVDKKGLDIHTRKHTGERPFKCDLCLYAAKRRSALNVHLQTHSKDGAAATTTTTSTRRQRGKASAVTLPTEVANYETVGQASAAGAAAATIAPETSQQTPQQMPGGEQKYTIMAPYHQATLVCPVNPQDGSAEVTDPAKPVIGKSEPATPDSFNVQIVAGCITKPVQPVWQNI